MRSLFKAWVFVSLVFGGTSSFAGTPLAQAKLGTKLQQAMEAKKDQPLDVLIYLSAKADLKPAKSIKSKKAKGRFVHEALVSTSRATQTHLRSQLSKAGIKFKSYYIANVVAAFDVPHSEIMQLAGRDDVARILGNPKVKVIDPITKAHAADENFFGPGPNIVRTGATEVWSQLGVTGEGIVVANQDTGFDWDHPALKNQYRGWNGTTADHNYNWHDAIHSGRSNPCGFASEEPCDDHGHGTHTLGTSVGDDGNGNQVGVAPGAKWIACRNMDAGTGQPSTYIECFQYFLAPWPYGGDPESEGDPDKAAHVINNSWGCPSAEGCEGDEFIPVLEALKEAGIMVVAAAGNAGSSCGTINDGPAHHSELVLSVGAMDHRNDRIASFSSRGPSTFDNGIGPDVSAPGVSVRSSTKGGGYSGSMWSGTSMASPHVAGAVALLWSADPTLVGDIDGTMELFRSTAEAATSSQSCAGRSGNQIPNNTFGHGIMNIFDTVSSRVRL
jgi:subtilisin family serine protease